MNSKKEKLIGIVGKENVLDDSESLEIYSQDQSFVHPVKPWFVVKPKNVDEVQGIVKWANETSTPLVPVSSGRPHFRGDTVPSATGAAIVDLSRMNRIISINRRNRMTIIEPGVTYSHLQPELAKEGLRLSTSLLPRANKSVIASLLEREPRLNPRYQWAYLDPLRCLEVVWGDGNKMWTGEAGGGVPVLEDLWKREKRQVLPAGPSQTNFYNIVSGAQGSMGIVTWASLKCHVLPELRRLFFASAEKLDDLMGFTYRLLRFRFGDELLLLNSTNLAYILGAGDNNITALREEMPPWVVILGIAGRNILPREKVEFQEKDVTDIAQQFGLRLVSAIPGVSSGQVMEVMLAPSREPYWKLSYKGGCQDIFFVTTLERTPGFVTTMYAVAQALGYPIADIGVYIQPQHQGASCHCEFNLPYNPGDQREVTRMRELFTKASEELIKQGAFFSRPYGIWADMAFNKDAQTTILLKKIKVIFDPNNVMNPGKLCF